MKKKQNTGSLKKGENFPKRDYRGKNAEIKNSDNAKAPDGVSGDWQ